LKTKEVDDDDKDYLSMDLKDFAKLAKDEVNIAYNRLVKLMNVVFSGSVNPMINKLDYRKVTDLSNRDKTK
jgi:hypothetical protein